MALLSKILRNVIAMPHRGKSKQYNVHRDIDFTDESDDGISVYGKDLDPQAPLPPGMKMDYDPVPVEVFYDLASKELPRVAQPAYMSFVRGEQIWHVFNANAITLGRMASRAAQFLQAKHRPNYTHSHVLPESQGDFVVVVNAKYPLVYGTKGKMKIYRKHSGYPGHLQELNIRQVLQRDWKRIVKDAIDGMLPKNNVRPNYIKRLHIFPEIYHDFDFLPQFLQRPLPDPNEILQNKDFLNDPQNATIVFASDPNNISEEFKSMKYDPQPFDVPLSQRTNFRDRNLKELKIVKRYNRILRRFKVFNHRTQKFEIK